MMSEWDKEEKQQGKGQATGVGVSLGDRQHVHVLRFRGGFAGCSNGVRSFAGQGDLQRSPGDLAYKLEARGAEA
jgi:hypothetical protein